MRRLLASPEHEATYNELCGLLRRHTEKLTAIEVLAVAANMVGKIVALQDQRKVSKEIALEVVRINLENGNKQILDQLAQTKGSG